MPAFRIVGALIDWPLADGENVIGSDETADIRVESADVAARHAVIEVRTDGVWVREEEGKVIVNGREAGLVAKLSPGDVISVGGAELRLAWTGFEEEHPKVQRRRWWLRLCFWGAAGGGRPGLVRAPRDADLHQRLPGRGAHRKLRRAGAQAERQA